MEYYFAFGSNMNPARMRARSVPYRARVWGILPGYRLAFDKRAGSPQGAGYATIHRDPLDAVEGVLYRVTRTGIAILDRYEGVPYSYERMLLPIIRTDGMTVQAHVYLAHPRMVGAGLLPTRAYLAHLLAGRDLLSSEYLALLKSAVTLPETVRRYQQARFAW